MPKLFSTIFILILISISCHSNAPDEGSDTIIAEKSNYAPDKKAILFLREAGATVSDSYQISVLNNKYIFDSTSIGNTFIADNGHNKTNLDTTALKFRWLANDTLEIDYDQKLRIFKMEKKVLGVTINYKAR